MAHLRGGGGGGGGEEVWPAREREVWPAKGEVWPAKGEGGVACLAIKEMSVHAYIMCVYMCVYMYMCT